MNLVHIQKSCKFSDQSESETLWIPHMALISILISLICDVTAEKHCVLGQEQMWHFQVEIGSLWDCEYKAWTNVTTFF